jgi:MinD-like ATPase involved in chromosome partitioning or flagellar assembly
MGLDGLPAIGQVQPCASNSDDIEHLYRPTLYPALDPAPPKINCTLATTATAGGNNAQIVAVQSFRGGTGKSTLISNLAVLMAQQGKRVGIIDTDLQSPGMQMLLGLEQKPIDLTLNDYLWHRCALHEATYDLSDLLPAQPDLSTAGALYLIPASVQANDLTILQKGYSQARLLEGFTEITHDLQLDFLFVDTHSGIDPAILKTIAACSLLIVLLTPNDRDDLGTTALVELFRKLSVDRMWLVANKALPKLDVDNYIQQLETVYDLPVAAVLPFSVKTIELTSNEVFSLRYPDHPLTQAIAQISDLIVCSERSPQTRHTTRNFRDCYA